LHNTAIEETLRATEAEGRALMGSNLSADFGAKTRLGFGEELSPSGEVNSLGLASKR
jgi:hypothetical protein